MDEAIYATEEGFMSVVKNGYQGNSDLTRIGTCCICCYMWRNKWLYVSNLGDSQAVLGSRRGVSTYARELVSVHNCNIGEKFRNGLRNWRSNPRFVVEERNAWRVEGVSKITRSIGDAYLKYRPKLLNCRGFTHEYMSTPVIHAQPDTHWEKISDNDDFLLIGSHGFWEFMPSVKADPLQTS